MTHIIDMEARKLLWQDTLASTGELRAAKVASLGVSVLSAVGSHVDLYYGHDQVFERTFLMLDSAELLTGLLDPYLALESPDEASRLFPEDFIALVAARLARVARGGDEGAAELFQFWRRGLYDRSDRDPETLTVAETAALFGISPQAVYKWINAGRVEADKGPDGKLRLNVEALRTSREDERRVDQIRGTLSDLRRRDPIDFDPDGLSGVMRRG